MEMQQMLTQLLQAEGRLLSDRLASAFARVDRRAFLAPEPTSPHQFAYKDTPLPIGYGQTISAPHMHATCLDLLEDKLQPGARVLDVGSGSGFLLAVMGLLVLPGGHVTGVEKVTDLAQRSVQSIQASQPDLLRDGTVNILAGNALSDILAGEEEYDAIHVGAAAASMPNTLLAKLAKGGRMVIPVGDSGMQALQQVDRADDGSYKFEELMSVRYVPLLPPEES